MAKPFDDKGSRWYLKKKGISHVADNLCEAIAKLELQMEDDNVSYEDLAAGRATEKVMELRDRTIKYQLAADSVVAKAIHESNKNNEWEELSKEIAQHDAEEQKQAINNEAYEKAKEQYAITGDHRAFEAMAKASGIIDEISGANRQGYVKSDVENMRETERALLEKHLQERQSDREVRDKSIETLGKSENPSSQAIARHLRNKKLKEETLNAINEGAEHEQAKNR
jgi:hypothetical protein